MERAVTLPALHNVTNPTGAAIYAIYAFRPFTLLTKIRYRAKRHEKGQILRRGPHYRPGSYADRAGGIRLMMMDVTG